MFINTIVNVIDLTNKLVKNYNERINDFAFEMVNNPLIIRDYDNPIETTRKQFMDEMSRQIEGGRKRLIFNKFTTEKERVVSLLYYLTQLYVIESVSQRKGEN